MADGRAKAVLSAMADLNSRTNYILDHMTVMSREVEKGDSLDIPSMSALTVATSGASDVSAETVTNAVLTLTVNRDPMINVDIPQLTKMQMLNGSWAQQVAENGIRDLRNSMDTTLVGDLLTLAYDSSATYHDNVAGDSLTSADILNAKAALLDNAGSRPEALKLFVSSFGEASIGAISAFVPNYTQSEMGNLGIPKIGTVHGIPVYVSQSVKRGRTVAATASAIASNVITFTVAAGHNVVPGQKITSAGATTNITTAVAVTSVTATTIVAPLTASNDATNGAATITIDASENLLVDTSHQFVAYQAMPQTRVVPYELRHTDHLHIWSAWGAKGRTGRVRVLCSPRASA